MGSLTSYETEYFTAIGIDPNAVGAEVAVGAQSLVRTYGKTAKPDQVIKVPLYQVRSSLYSLTLGRMLGQSYDTARRELDVCSEYFEPYMVPTEIRGDRKRGKFCIIQDRVKMNEITPENIKEHPGRGEQLGDIMERNRKMIAERKAWLDAMGWNLKKFLAFRFQKKPYLDNVAVAQETEKLTLFDFGLFPMPEQTVFRYYYRELLQTQQQNMKGYGFEFGG